MSALLVRASGVSERATKPAFSAARPWLDRLTDPETAVIGSILLLALVFRSAELERLPWGYAGLHIDAAFNGEVAFRILDGQQFFTPVTVSLAYARDTITHFYLVPFFALLGRSVETLRLACTLLALLNCFLLFRILRQYTPSLLVAGATTALYAFSGADAIFAMSGIEYIMATPLLLGSFLLFTRALRTGRPVDAVLAGFFWGLGYSSHYSFLYLGAVVPAVAAFHFRAARPWLPWFLISAFLGALPKLSYLVFNHQSYLHRISDVSRHAPGHFRKSVARLWTTVV
ncbi:MAG: glycosyltransferase family 39 protein [Acidobacteriota bacterium]